MPAVKFGNVWSWADDLDGQTLAQAQRTAQLPFVVKPVTLMPDAHFGYGVCVGAVIATRGAVIPSAVGVDIGCGMIAALTDLFASDLPDDRLKGLNGKIGLAVPSGTGQGHKDRRTGTNAQYRADKALGRLVGWEHAPDLNDHQRTTAIEQFGSLGSGNHFVEIDLDEQGRVWVVLHSGSRGIGNQLANIHIDGAKGLMKGHFATPEDEDLASLVEGTPEFDAYIEALLWSQDYAAGNREQMMTSTLFELFRAVGKGRELERINCHHNYAQRETHEGRDLWVTRKGAISARAGELGIIPGSMGTSTYIVEGLGNPESFCSCSHGAGRKLSRAQARKQLDVEGFVKLMEGKVWDRSRAGETKRGALIEEDPRAYKDIEQVMANQADLVVPKYKLTQILNYKG